MNACIPGPHIHQDAQDLTLCSWRDDPVACVCFKHTVPITDVKSAQQRVYSEKAKDIIESCEENTKDVPHFLLKFTEFGHPMFNGMFPACLNGTKLLKNEVGKLSLPTDDRNQAVNETSPAAVKALNVSLRSKRKHLSGLNWCTEGW